MKIRRAGVGKVVVDLMLSHMSARGYARLSDVALTRDRGAWRDVVFVQLSSPRAQSICATAGVDVPVAREYATGTSTETVSIAVGGRLSERGINVGDMWLPAETREQVEAAAHHLASTCLQQESWFGQFHSLLDVIEAYFRQSGLQPLGCNEYWKQVFLFNYASMLLAAGRRAEAEEWLGETERVIRSAKKLDADDRARLQRVSALLADVRS